MHTNAAGLEIIKRNEGLRLDAYQDVVGVWTIGYGDTGPDVRQGLRITREEAERRLVERLACEFEPGVLRAIGDSPTTENQFSAMVSLAYNIGVGAFKSSTVARVHRAGDHRGAAEAFGLWNRAGGSRARRSDAASAGRGGPVPAARCTRCTGAGRAGKAATRRCDQVVAGYPARRWPLPGGTRW